MDICRGCEQVRRWRSGRWSWDALVGVRCADCGWLCGQNGRVCLAFVVVDHVLVVIMEVWHRCELLLTQPGDGWVLEALLFAPLL